MEDVTHHTALYSWSQKSDKTGTEVAGGRVWAGRRKMREGGGNLRLVYLSSARPATLLRSPAASLPAHSSPPYQPSNKPLKRKAKGAQTFNSRSSCTRQRKALGKGNSDPWGTPGTTSCFLPNPRPSTAWLVHAPTHLEWAEWCASQKSVFKSQLLCDEGSSPPKPKVKFNCHRDSTKT